MAYTFINISQEEEESTQRSYWKLWFLVLPVLFIISFLHWGGYLLVSRDSVQQHIDAAVVLQGSIASVNARTAAAMSLLQKGAADHVAISVPRETYWGAEVPPIARQYLEKTYGSDLAARVDFCTTQPDLNSTQREVLALNSCIQQHGWKNIALLTSNYQSRRVRIVWRKTLPQGDGSVAVSVEGIADAAYQPNGWWRERPYAETWIKESAKLAWASL